MRTAVATTDAAHNEEDAVRKLWQPALRAIECVAPVSTSLAASLCA
jgi:hypothetical protein